jgi:purine catabolism regulator
LRVAFDHARQALGYARLSGDDEPRHFGDLGLEELLMSLAAGPELARFVEAELSPLLEHDAKSSTPLIPVLRCYLESGAAKSETARRLHVERRTVYRRLAMITTLLGKDLSGVETQARLFVAVRGLELLRHRRSRESVGV